MFPNMDIWCKWSADILVGLGILESSKADKNVGAPKKRDARNRRNRVGTQISWP